MTKKKQTLITIGVAILVVAGALTIGPVLNSYFEKNNSNHDRQNMPMANESGSFAQTDSSDYKTYTALTGDVYDSAFIANMIVHHEGAVTMAETALTNAKRQEIKDMANDIILAQSKEITEMKQWQQQWGYTDSSQSADHSTGGHDSMSTVMTNMGDDFDKAFLEQMIMHHQAAINMAAPGEINAKHQEVKDLTKAVVGAQSKEIVQMQAWQKEWGFKS